MSSKHNNTLTELQDLIQSHQLSPSCAVELVRLFRQSTHLPGSNLTVLESVYANPVELTASGKHKSMGFDGDTTDIMLAGKQERLVQDETDVSEKHAALSKTSSNTVAEPPVTTVLSPASMITSPPCTVLPLPTARSIDPA